MKGTNERLRCSREQRAQLEKMAGSRTEEARMVERSRIVLMLSEGESGASVARKLDIHVQTVSRWRDRFIAGGIAGLRDQPRSGKPRTYGSDFEAAVLSTLEETPPDGMARWDGGSIAKRLGSSDDAVWRVLRKHGICVSRQRSWCVSTDPNFAAKAADIVGLYVAPPVKAVVISVDEKPMIQAIERQTGYVRTGDRKVVRGLQSTYKRHGTLNLFAALEVATGSVRGKSSEGKRRVDFIAFMDEVIADYSADTELHIIADNHSIHKGLDHWLSLHPNVHCHYTPTSASWLNMVEIWFGIFTRKVLVGASFTSVDDLASKIAQYLDAYPEIAHPFVWRKRDVVGAQLKNTVVNLCD